MNIGDISLMLGGMLNPFLFLAIGVCWLALAPKLLGSWLLSAGGCLLFFNAARAYYEATHPTSSSWVDTVPYAASLEIAPLLLAIGIFLVVRAELAVQP